VGEETKRSDQPGDGGGDEGCEDENAGQRPGILPVVEKRDDGNEDDEARLSATPQMRVIGFGEERSREQLHDADDAVKFRREVPALIGLEDEARAKQVRDGALLRTCWR